MITKSKSKSKFFNFKNTSLLILFIFLLLVTYLVKSGFRLNLYNWAKETGQICIPGVDVIEKSCPAPYENISKVRVCNSSGTGWDPWQDNCPFSNNNNGGKGSTYKTCKGSVLSTCTISGSTETCSVTANCIYGCSQSESRCKTKNEANETYCESRRPTEYYDLNSKTWKKCPAGKICKQANRWSAECI